ncbi:tRNA synthetases class I (M)-domain-containing protein [Hypoxylon rubiginosum]|uniref:tRNA synthetases class I (M)-domain-containing protein n=1 Tax=Hypoxylon rubiginosum TaxID=110542 RepID=A0ACB9YZ23_9PEZI|nr:tRNA synthetases class I (M)-domain-containing protein [Hypoxylon rubiginosum]
MKSHWGALSRHLSTIRGGSTLRTGWICQSCRVQARRKLSSSSAALREAKDKPYYVTTPIFYVNASPHVGHLYSMLIADILKRWQVLKGKQAILSTGTDEHGMKVQRAAEIQDVHPKALCDANSETFRDLARKANIANDYFIRTTDPEHRDAVEYFWARLRESGHIYETKHEGWYCVGDETFYPHSMVEKRVSPLTGKAFMASTETGNAVEWTEEKNYHFRLTAFRDRLLQFYDDNPGWVVPNNRFVEVISWVQNNLEDLSISRPISRLDWGIPVPDDPSQTIYVWVDALINYITVAGYPVWPPGSEHKKGWPADVQVVGKDIVRFHSVYWPALLMALDLPPPKRILSHGHWLMSRQKMSKSVGNVVNPFFALDRWGVDTMRYFLTYNGAMANDSDYSNEFIVDRYKKGLQGGLGNLLNRITRPKNWSVRTAVAAMSENKDEALSEVVDIQKGHLTKIAEKAAGHMEELNPSGALKEIMEFVFETNRFLQNAAPWDKSKEGDTVAVNQIVFYAAESIRVVGILLQPFIPEKSAELLDRLGVGHDRRTFQHAELHADDSYGTPMVPLGEGAQRGLFPPIPVED